MALAATERINGEYESEVDDVDEFAFFDQQSYGQELASDTNEDEAWWLQEANNQSLVQSDADEDDNFGEFKQAAQTQQ